MSKGKAKIKKSKKSKKPRSGFGSALARLFFDNFWLKLISLSFALGFYAFIHSAQNAQRSIQVAIIAEMPPKGAERVLMTKIPETVYVTVVGSRSQLDVLRGEQLDPIRLQLQGAQNGDLAISADMISGLPTGLRVTRILPSSLTIRWENVVQASIKVQVAITGKAAKGLELVGEVQVQPDTIFATGPEPAVKVIQFARAEAFDLSGLSEDKHSRLLRLDPPPTDVSWSRDNVQATVVVARKMAKVKFEKLTVEAVGLPRAKMKPKTVDVYVTGTPEQLEALTKDAIVPRVEPKKTSEDLSQPGSAVMPVIVDTIANAKVVIQPPKVLVKW